mmetsp:Transcript_59676/g.142333  ORF Transcript_59676/g.142333 Transcript_59676/m.142333 type:complete len:216 (-) Transcript_59676:287-934(-)
MQLLSADLIAFVHVELAEGLLVRLPLPAAVLHNELLEVLFANEGHHGEALVDLLQPSLLYLLEATLPQSFVKVLLVQSPGTGHLPKSTADELVQVILGVHMLEQRFQCLLTSANDGGLALREEGGPAPLAFSFRHQCKAAVLGLLMQNLGDQLQNLLGWVGPLHTEGSLQDSHQIRALFRAAAFTFGSCQRGIQGLDAVALPQRPPDLLPQKPTP